ncbi:hypothetical protein F4815DRAFT_468587 [Daldinia loculata]|nr:hypothetical protein F4815DRAFT_468587 [Daldinia loculata]
MEGVSTITIRQRLIERPIWSSSSSSGNSGGVPKASSYLRLILTGPNGGMLVSVLVFGGVAEPSGVSRLRFNNIKIGAEDLGGSTSGLGVRALLGMSVVAWISVMLIM